ncbi:hypothetical protein C810_03857 [Lachnospiraceae bacterium A2]|nr:hypothetical protein C810_03857 [Lachnospiraceae bacterium A2]
MEVKGKQQNKRCKKVIWNLKSKLYLECIGHVKEERFKKCFRTYVYTAVVMVIMLIVLFWRLHIYPFGNNTLIYLDGDQYFSFTKYLQNTFFTNNNLLYSWSNVLGGGMVNTFAYYCSSPFNLILIFFKNHFLLGYHVVFCIKMLMAALFFAVLINAIWCITDEKKVVLFSASYPFIGYVVGFAWHQSWMDGVIFLPLLLVGIRNIVKKQKVLLYIVMLSLSLLANFYIGYMMCIMSAILFGSTIFLEYKSFNRKVIKEIILYIYASISAVALAAVLLLPVYFNLPEERKQSILELFGNMGYRCMPEDILSMVYGNSMVGLEYVSNFPFIFVGIFQILLVVLFFINRKIPQKIKAVSGTVISIFLISFMNTSLDVIWHGMSKNVGFNYRYSFCLSFVLELIAFYSFMHIQEVGRWLLSTGACLGALTVLMMGQGRTNVDAKTLLMDMILIFVVLILLYVYIEALRKGSRRKDICYALLFCITLGNIMGNGIMGIKEMQEKIPDSIMLSSEYKEAMNIENVTDEMISEDGFYRRASAVPFRRCDAMLFGYDGVHNYASTENLDVLQTAKGLGITHTWMWCAYNDNVPMSTDVLLGIKYITLKRMSKQKDYILIGNTSKQGEDLYVLKNENAMPLVFPVESEINVDNLEGNPFIFLNSYWNSIRQAEGDVFYEMQYDKNSVVTDSGKDIHIRFVAKHENPVYMYIPAGEVTVEDIKRKVFLQYSRNQEIVYVGSFKEGEEVEIAIHVTGMYEGEEKIALFGENQNALFNKAQHVLKKEIHINKESSSRLSLQYNAEHNEVLSSTIPYDDGWHVYIDGQKTVTRKNMNSFLAFDYPQGQHEVVFVYEPKGLKAGCIISGITFLLLLLFTVFKRKQDETNVRKLRRNSYGKTK